MRLLVSVRDADEARIAVASGPGVVDAKEPGAGALGAVAAATLAAIAAVVPAGHRLSVALGEPAGAEALAGELAARRHTLRGRAAFVKFVPPALDLETITGCVRTVRRLVPDASVIVAAYADVVDPPTLAALPARVAAAAGLLLDTRAKHAGLLAHLSRQALAALADHARDAGVLLALAGSLRAVDVVTVAALGADVVGVRGAACDGGREGRISPVRLAALHRALRDAPAPAAPTW